MKDEEENKTSFSVMLSRIFVIVLFFFIIATVLGCNTTGSKNSSRNKGNLTLNDSLKINLPNPDTLLAKAKAFFQEGKLNNTKLTLKQIIYYYKDSKDSVTVAKANEFLKKVDEAIYGREEKQKLPLPESKNKIIAEEKEKQNVLQSEKTSYPMVRADSYSVGSKERAFAEFLISWQKKNWSRMVKFTQKTWSSGESNPAETLEAWYGFKDLLGAKITKKTAESNVAVDITATIYYAFGSEIKTKSITARVIREVAPYKPSPKGEWGVNPISTIAEE